MTAAVRFVRTQLHLAKRWNGGWGGALRLGALTCLTALVAFAVAVWLLPDITVRSWPAALATAVALVAVTALSRPLLIAALSRVSIAAVGVAVLAVQGATLLGIAAATRGIDVDGVRGALHVALVYAIVHTVLAAGLVIASDEAFFGTLVRQLAARRAGRANTRQPGVVFVQIDGLSHPVLERAIERGDMPTLARWVGAGDATLDRWEPVLPTQTSASQAGILHGDNDEIPGFRWWEKDGQRLFVSNHPSDARDIMRRVSNGRGLLANGASIGNLLSGDAPRSYLTASTVEWSEIRKSHVLDWFFISPFAYVRWFVLSVGEIVKEQVQAARERRSGIEPRGARGFAYALARAATNVLLRHLVGALVIEEMYEGTPVIYADFVDYDEIAHHAGVERIEARQALAGLDRILALIGRAALDAPRRYRIVVLSDHGQTPGPMFETRFGRKLDAVVADLMGGDVDTHAPGSSERGGHFGTRHIGAVKAITRLFDRGRSDDEPPELVVAASGNLAHVSFPRIPGRVERTEIDRRYPRLIDGLVRHAGVGFVMVRDGKDPVVIGGEGRRVLCGGAVTGEDPLVGYGRRAVAGLERIDAMPNCADLVVMGRFDPKTAEAISFEQQIGSHGGLGGIQGEAFVLRPSDWSAPGTVVGATALHTRLRTWLRDLGLEPSG